MREFDEKSITQAVDRAPCPNASDPRFKRIMTSLVTHLHDFVREVRLTEAEWLTAIQFLTDVGQTCTDKRQEFILLSDTLGVSVLVITLNHPADQGSAESTVWVRSTGRARRSCRAAATWPMASRASRRSIPDGCSARMAGRSRMRCSTSGRAMARATTTCRFPEETGMKARGKIRTDAEGRYWFRSIRPTFYPVPTDGPVGRMLRKMGRHPYRPGHIHMIVSAAGHLPVTTHLFVAGQRIPGFRCRVRHEGVAGRAIRAPPAGRRPGRRAHGEPVLHGQLRLPAAA